MDRPIEFPTVFRMPPAILGKIKDTARFRAPELLAGIFYFHAVSSGHDPQFPSVSVRSAWCILAAASGFATLTGAPPHLYLNRLALRISKRLAPVCAANISPF